MNTSPQQIETQHSHLRSDSLLSVRALTVEYKSRSGAASVKAVSGVSLDVLPGESLGLVGESGCGKSSTARAILQLPRPVDGSVQLGGVELTTLRGRSLRQERLRMQAIFQDPVSSLNPRRTVGSLLAEPAIVWGLARRREDIRRLVDDALLSVGLDPDSSRERRATLFSGGQCQRISIARALILDPDIIVCDEPVSALDVSVQAQILNLLRDLRAGRSLSLLFISHDLAVVKNICDRVGVMYLGKIVEIAESSALYSRPAHPYTRALLAAVPGPASHAGGHKRLSGEMPSPMNPPSGCRFRTRCPRAESLCSSVEPVLREIGRDHSVACHFPHASDEPIHDGTAASEPIG